MVFALSVCPPPKKKKEKECNYLNTISQSVFQSDHHNFRH